MILYSYAVRYHADISVRDLVENRVGDEVRKKQLIQLLGIDLDWRMHEVYSQFGFIYYRQLRIVFDLELCAVEARYCCIICLSYSSIKHHEMKFTVCIVE